MGRAFLGEAELTEREGAVLLALAGTVFSFTAVAYRAVDTANDWQFLAYRGGSTALAMFFSYDCSTVPWQRWSVAQCAPWQRWSVGT